MAPGEEKGRRHVAQATHATARWRGEDPAAVAGAARRRHGVRHQRPTRTPMSNPRMNWATGTKRSRIQTIEASCSATDVPAGGHSDASPFSRTHGRIDSSLGYTAPDRLGPTPGHQFPQPAHPLDRSGADTHKPE